MKNLFLPLIFSISAHAQFAKPELVALYASSRNYNIPSTASCFYSEPAVTLDAIYLGCLDEQGALMMRWSAQGHEVLARARGDNLFSRPEAFHRGVGWYEFSQESAQRTYVHTHDLKVQKVSHLGTVTNFIPLDENEWIYVQKKESPEVWFLRSGQSGPLFTQDVSYIFGPAASVGGEVAFKVRRNSLDEKEPDELWLLKDGKWKKIFEDRDANSASPWRSFRHQLSVDAGEVLTFASDEKGEVLLLINSDGVREIARPGGMIKSFDYFSPRMRNGVVVFRGVDLQGRKTIWAWTEGKLKALVTQGDTIRTDRGLGIVHYHNEHAIFYGSPGIGPQGDVVLQATLSDANYPRTLLGVGVVRFKRE